MRDIQISRPVLIALIGAILVGGFLFYKSQSGEEAAPPPPVAEQPAPTGSTGASTAETGATGATGGTGETGEKLTAVERREKARKARRERLIAAAKEKGMPLTVYEGLKANKVVLIYFWNPKAKADQHVNDSVSEVKNDRGKKLVVIREKMENKSRYQGIAKVAEITQTPGIVLLYGDAADAWMGYIDGVALNSRISVVIDQGG